jgi:DNA polymerase-3 subunit gamma/tau
MFENLIAQDEARALLEGDLASGSLPPSLLFSGPPASGKLTAALELARVLSCEAGGREGGQATGAARGAWNCPCPACVRHRALSHPDLLLYGRRSFPEEIPVAAETLARSPGKASLYFFIRAVRKLLKRFDPALWEGEEAKLAKAAPLVAELEERLGLLDPSAQAATAAGAEPERAGEAATVARELLPLARKLEDLVPDMPPVVMVRSAEGWARLAPWGRHKTIVVENAEAMNESARNALLKILEEPPASLSFILLSSRRSSMMRTILSRLRTYPFQERGPEDTALVLSRVFRAGEARLEGAGPAHLGIGQWLASKGALPPAKARELGRNLLAAILLEREGQGGGESSLLRAELSAARGEGLDIGGAIAVVLKETKELGQKDEAFASSFEALLAALESCLGEELRYGTGRDGRELPIAAADLAWMAEAAELVRLARMRRETFNLPAALLLESLAWRLRDLGGAGEGRP